MEFKILLKRTKRVYVATQRSVQSASAIRNNLVKLKCSTAEIVARHNRETGFSRMDLWVTYLAVRESLGAEQGGVRLLEKLLRVDLTKRRGDRALLALMQRGTLAGSVFVPADLVLNTNLILGSDVGPLALALATGEPEVDITIKTSRSDAVYDSRWLQSKGFTDDEIGTIELARQSVFERLGTLPVTWEKLSQMQNSLSQLMPKGATLHGRGDFYQSCEELLVRGQRPTEARFRAYGLSTILKSSDRVLDIGCNCGFFSLLAAKHVLTVDAFDINPAFVSIAKLAQRYLERENCRFLTSSFDTFSTPEPYDVIFSFAVHHWIGLPLPVYAERLRNLLKPGGLVLVESQDLNTHDQDWDDKVKVLCGAGFKEIGSGALCDDGQMARRFVLLRDAVRNRATV
jgi:SAM-dependent methyltransferase